jgi:predicted phosphohydrolase
MRLAWLTDIHLNFLDREKREVFYQSIVENTADALLITGDIAEADCIASLLTEMANHLKKLIYFVLGNHDYYRGSVTQVRNTMTELTHQHSLIKWLPAIGVQKLNDKVFIVGQDGWADGRFGDYENSRVALNDSLFIQDLFLAKRINKQALIDKMQALADHDANNLKDDLMIAIKQQPQKIVVLVHIPPFKEACCHQGKVSDDNWLPFFSSKILGDVLLEIAQVYIEIDFLVLCGHTHSSAFYQPLKNLTAKAGAASYYLPTVQELIVI